MEDIEPAFHLICQLLGPSAGISAIGGNGC
jgi:hypothetical protein